MRRHWRSIRTWWADMSGWDGSRPLYDPMCGSGTLISEAWLKFCRIPAGYLRRKFGFTMLPDFDAAICQSVSKQIRNFSVVCCDRRNRYIQQITYRFIRTKRRTVGHGAVFEAAGRISIFEPVGLEVPHVGMASPADDAWIEFL